MTLYFRWLWQRISASFASCAGVSTSTVVGAVAVSVAVIGLVAATNNTPAASATITDPQCSASQPTCAMTFQETALDRDPLQNAQFGQPKPGLLAGYSAGNLTNITTMAGTCPIANASENCGYKNHYTTADNGSTYYFRNCLIQTPTNASAILVDTSSTVKLYFTNCRIEQNATYPNYNGVQSNGAIGNGGSLHFIHDLFIHGPSLCSSGATNSCITAGTMMEPNGTTDSEVVYSEFDGLSDNIRADRPVNIQWNYLHANFCITDACAHGDPIEVYRGNAAQPVTISNNYFSGPEWDSSAGMNLTNEFGANGNVFFTHNKILPPNGSYGIDRGWILVSNQDNGISAGSPTNQSTPNIFGVHITDNTLFEETGAPVALDPSINPPYKYPLMTRFLPPGTALPTQCDSAARGGSDWGPNGPNTCLTDVQRNTYVSAAGVSNEWPYAGCCGSTTTTTTAAGPTTTTTTGPTTTTTAPNQTCNNTFSCWPGPSNTGYQNAPGYPGTLATAGTSDATHNCPATDVSGVFRSLTPGTTVKFCSYPGGFGVGVAGGNLTNIHFIGIDIAGNNSFGSTPVLVFCTGCTFDYITMHPAGLTSVPSGGVAYPFGYGVGMSVGTGSFNTFAVNVSITHSDFWGFGQAITIGGNNRTSSTQLVISDNYIHDPTDDWAQHCTEPPPRPGCVYHANGISQTNNNATMSWVTVNHNNIQGNYLPSNPSESDAKANGNAIGFQTGTYNNVTVTNNLISGYKNTLDFRTLASDGGGGSNDTFTGNVLTNTFQQGTQVERGSVQSCPGCVWANNHFLWNTSGQAVPALFSSGGCDSACITGASGTQYVASQSGFCWLPGPTLSATTDFGGGACPALHS